MTNPVGETKDDPLGSISTACTSLRKYWNLERYPSMPI